MARDQTDSPEDKDLPKGSKLKSSSEKAFSTLNDRFIGAGRIKSSLIFSSGEKDGNKNKMKGKGNSVIEAQRSSSLYDESSSSSSVGPKSQPKNEMKNLGKGWFDMQPMKLDDNVRRDIKMIQMRNYLDPKRFYKNPDKLGAVLHVGTVIEGPSEYKSSRLTKKERKQSIVDEILADKSIKDYSKRKFNEIQADKQNKRRTYKVKKSAKKDSKKKIRKLF